MNPTNPTRYQYLSLWPGITFEELDDLSRDRQNMRCLGAAPLAAGFSKLAAFGREGFYTTESIANLMTRFVKELVQRFDRIEDKPLNWTGKHFGRAAYAMSSYLPNDKTAKKVMLAIANHSLSLLSTAPQKDLYYLLESFSKFKFEERDLETVNACIAEIAEHLFSQEIPLDKLHKAALNLLESTPNAAELTPVRSLFSRITDTATDSMSAMSFDKLALLARTLSLWDVRRTAEFIFATVEKCARHPESLSNKDLGLVFSALSRYTFSDEQLREIRPFVSTLMQTALQRITALSMQDLSMIVESLHLLDVTEQEGFLLDLRRALKAFRPSEISWADFKTIMVKLARLPADGFLELFKIMIGQAHLSNIDQLESSDLIHILTGLSVVYKNAKIPTSNSLSNLLWKLIKAANTRNSPKVCHTLILCLSKYHSHLDASHLRIVDPILRQLISSSNTTYRASVLEFMAKMNVDSTQISKYRSSVDLLNGEWNSWSAATAIQALTAMDSLDLEIFEGLMKSIDVTDVSHATLGRFYPVYHYCQVALRWPDEVWPRQLLDRIKDYSWVPKDGRNVSVELARELSNGQPYRINQQVGIYQVDILLPDSKQIFLLSKDTGSSRFKQKYLRAMGYSVNEVSARDYVSQRRGPYSDRGDPYPVRENSRNSRATPSRWGVNPRLFSQATKALREKRS